MQSINRVVRFIDSLFWLCIPLSLFCFAVALLSATELPRLKQLDSELRTVKARLLSKEVWFIRYRNTPVKFSIEQVENETEVDGQRGFWCAMGAFEIEQSEDSNLKGKLSEGSLSKVSPGTPFGKTRPIYYKAEALADAAEYSVGNTYSGWAYFDQPGYVLFSRPYLAARAQLIQFIVAGAGSLALFGLRIVVGLILNRRRHQVSS